MGAVWLARGWPLLASSCLVACFPREPAPPRERAAAPPVVASAPASSTPPEPPAPMPRPHRGRLDAAVGLNDACVRCHAEEATEWRGSRHHESDTNLAYQKAFAIEPSAFCRGCHAPEADPAKAPPRAVSELGVGCVTCHVTEEGSVLAAPSLHGDRRAPHAVRRSPDFAATGGCASCHEFRVPGARSSRDPEMMQTTLREHARSPARAEPCASCHMPGRAGRPSHAFAETRDPEWLRRSLEASAERDGDHLRVTLTQTTPGHAFPTGDLFRRLQVAVEARDAQGRVVRREARELARHFELVPGRLERHLRRDDRVFARPVTLDFELPEGQGSWWVTYQRVSTAGTGRRGDEAVLDSEVRLHEGSFPSRPGGDARPAPPPRP